MFVQGITASMKMTESKAEHGHSMARRILCHLARTRRPRWPIPRGVCCWIRSCPFFALCGVCVRWFVGRQVTRAGAESRSKPCRDAASRYSQRFREPPANGVYIAVEDLRLRSDTGAPLVQGIWVLRTAAAQSADRAGRGVVAFSTAATAWRVAVSGPFGGVPANALSVFCDVSSPVDRCGDRCVAPDAPQDRSRIEPRW